MRIKTKVIHYRVSEPELEALKRRAKENDMGVSELATKVMRFFAQVEMSSGFWNEISFKAKVAGKTPAAYFLSLVTEDKPKPKSIYPFGGDIRLVDEGEYGDSL